MSTLFSLERWRPRYLLGAWAAYWAGLVALKLGPAIISILLVISDKNGTSSVAAGFGDDAFTLSVVDAGRTIYSGQAPFETVALWVAGPPLLLWLAWLLTRPKRRDLPAGDTRIDALSAGQEPSMMSYRARSEERDAR
jgi:hypothetical protein